MFVVQLLVGNADRRLNLKRILRSGEAASYPTKLQIVKADYKSSIP